MFSGLYTGLQPSYLLPQYLATPAYNFGNLFVNPIGLESTTLFSINPFYSYQTQQQIELAPIQVEIPDENSQNLQKSQQKQKEPKRAQLCKKKIKTSSRRKNKKISQKDDRNVVSNLLKIFFKNLLDLHKWDDFIKKLIQRQENQTSTKRFYQWVNSFSINYRNYIKSKEIKLLLAPASKTKNYQKIFRVLLRRFIHIEGLSHSLTARRIDKRAVKRHVEGLRQIQELLASSQN